MKQVVRIIGGLYRGKKLQFPEIEGLRPTPDRVRETLFNWLMNDIRNARCLDAFAGSGALGLEAFSRGASQVTFVEQSPIACANLQKIITQFNTPQLHLIKTDTRLYLQNNAAQFDIVFLDPPFALDYLPQCLDTLFEHDTLVKNGLVYLESPVPIEINECRWQQIKLKKAGNVFYGLFRKLQSTIS